MAKRVRFGKQDIGAELLPVLTAGLYRNSLDTLREYIQNSIDAKAKNIELVIDPDVVSIADDGTGMTGERARRAIRLGISEKSPIENVGFRGIGIYSAFNLCDRLAIHTRARRQTRGYVLRFDFRRMREELLRESERAKQGLPRALYLEKLLEETVIVEPDSSETVPTHGTIAILSEVRGDVYDNLMDWDSLTAYLQNVVPLPFSPDFAYKRRIERNFRAKDYRVVRSLKLQVGSRREELYRPYHNGMFSHGGQRPPRFIDVSEDSQRFGFAWLCINDARRVLPDSSLRGILIKKFGFSISNRSFLEPYFGRTVFNRRLTGELIVQHDDLIPNAARSDFEHNSARQAFLGDALPQLIREISDWANRIQEEDKAREVLAEKSDRLGAISSRMPSIQRDREQLLLLNVELARIEDDLSSHAKVLEQIARDNFQSVESLLIDCQSTVREALVERRRSRGKLEERISRSVQRESVGPTEEDRELLTEMPATLLELLDAYDLLGDSDLRRAIRLLDEEVLQVLLDKDSYRDSLDRLRDLLEESS